MKNNAHPLVCFLSLLLPAFGTLSFLQAQVIFEGSYMEDFNTLPYNTNNTDPFTFTNNSTLPGWFTNRDGSARASSGQQSSFGQGIYSWGIQNSTERALGTFLVDGFSPDTAYFGVQLQNSTGSTINSLDVSYTIEQWRRNTNATTWTVDFLVIADPGNQLTASGYTNIPVGTVTAQVVGSASGLNGNQEANQQNFSYVLNDLQWEDGQYLWIRWGNSQGGTSSGLGLDNLTIAIPEPSVLQMALPVGFIAFSLLRFKRH